MSTITVDDIVASVNHWLATPVNHYVGSSYGSDSKSLLQRAMSDTLAYDEFVAKLIFDVPILGPLQSRGQISLELRDDFDRKQIELVIAGTTFEVANFNADES